MFRKFADRISAAASGAFSTNDNNTSDVDRLTAMGFDRAQATQALEATNGNVDQAAELLLVSVTSHPLPSSSPQQSVPQQQHRPTPTHYNQNNSNSSNNNNNREEEEDMQRALQASLEDTHLNSAFRPQQRTAAMQKAAEAAEARNKKHQLKTTSRPKPKTMTMTTSKTTTTTPTNTTTTPNLRLSTASRALAENHPGVKVIPKLQDKSIEEQILRCADRLKSSPAAVDTLYKACVTIQQNPHETKYRNIDTSTSGFQKSLANAPGALDLFKALNFQSITSTKLVLTLIDPARLYLAISALEQTKETVEYKTAKQRIQLTAELAQIQNLPPEQVSYYLSKCPSEPPEGRGAWMQVSLADHETIRRRFEADDTLQDVLYWIAAASHGGAVLLEKLQDSRDWMLQDLNRYPILPLDCIMHQHSTLQYLGCWPSGRLELVVSTPEWKKKEQVHGVDGTNGGVAAIRGSARGLGAAPKEAL